MKNQELIQLYNEECSRTGRTPLLKVNQNWLDDLNKKSFTQFTLNSNNPLIGIGYVIDNNVNTFEFVYED